MTAGVRVSRRNFSDRPQAGQRPTWLLSSPDPVHPAPAGPPWTLRRAGHPTIRRRPWPTGSPPPADRPRSPRVRDQRSSSFSSCRSSGPPSHKQHRRKPAKHHLIVPPRASSPRDIRGRLRMSGQRLPAAQAARAPLPATPRGSHPDGPRAARPAPSSPVTQPLIRTGGRIKSVTQELRRSHYGASMLIVTGSETMSPLSM